MSSNAFASRGASSNTRDAPLNRYTAVTVNASVYDVLNTLTSETNGTPPTPIAEATTGNVTVSAKSGKGNRAAKTPARSAFTARRPRNLTASSRPIRR